MSILVPDLCRQILLLLDYPHSGNLGSSYSMTRSHIDCNWATKSTSRMRKKLGQNRGELASHRSRHCLYLSIGIFTTLQIQLPTLPTVELCQSELLLRRSHHVLAWAMHFYVHSLPPGADIRIPAPLAASRAIYTFSSASSTTSPDSSSLSAMAAIPTYFIM